MSYKPQSVPCSQVVRALCKHELERIADNVASESDLARRFRKEKRSVLEACMNS